MVSDKNHVVLVFDENNLFVRENSINTVDKGDGSSSTSTVERSNESDQGWSRWVTNITNDHNDNRTGHWQYEGHMLDMWRPGYQGSHHIQLLFKNMPRIVAVPIQPLFHNLLFLLSGVLQTISGSWKAHQFLMQVFSVILN